MADGQPIPVRPGQLRYWISVLEYDPNPEILIPILQNLLLCADEPLKSDEEDDDG